MTVHFLFKFTTKILHTKNGKITSYSGGFDYFLEKPGTLEDDRAALTAGKIP